MILWIGPSLPCWGTDNLRRISLFWLQWVRFIETLSMNPRLWVWPWEHKRVSSTHMMLSRYLHWEIHFPTQIVSASFIIFTVTSTWFICWGDEWRRSEWLTVSYHSYSQFVLMTGPGCHQSELPNHGLKFFNGCTIPGVVPEVPAHPGSRQCKVRSPFGRVSTVCVAGKSAQVLVFVTKKKKPWPGRPLSSAVSIPLCRGIQTMEQSCNRASHKRVSRSVSGPFHFFRLATVLIYWVPSSRKTPELWYATSEGKLCRKNVIRFSVFSLK